MKTTTRIACMLVGTAISAQQAQTPPPQPPPAPTGYQDTPLQPNGTWRIHDGTRPQPRVVTPGPLVSLVAPAIVTVLHNGVTVHAAQTFLGPTVHKQIGAYAPSHAKGYIGLQDHGNPVRFRNIWIRPLAEAQ